MLFYYILFLENILIIINFLNNLMDYIILIIN